MIYLLRHGLDDENYIGGHSSIDLIPEGVSQIKNSALFIRDNLDINSIITSDIKRSVTSALIVKDILNKDVPFSVDSRLRELDKGDLTGRERCTLKPWEEKICNMTDINEKYPNGESMQDMYNRVKELLDTGYFLDKNYSLLVTHRGIINMIYFIFNNEPLTMNKKKFNVEHGSIHEMDIKKRKIKRIF